MPAQRTTVASLAFTFLFIASAALADEAPNTLTEAEKKDGWKLLFDGKSLDGWRIYKKKDAAGWVVKDGAMYLEKPGAGDLMTAEKYANFEFAIDWKFVSGNNSGVIYRVTEEAGGPTYVSGPEMQVTIEKPTAKPGATGGGSLYDMYAPTANGFKGLEWNTYKVVCNGKHIEQFVNGVKVVDCTIGSDDWNERLAKSKWKNEKLFATQAAGHLALQDHGSKILFRNVKIRVMDNAK